MNNDIQDKLVQAYLDYFKANDWWERSRSYRAYYATQKHLRQIKRLAKAKSDENHDYFYEHCFKKSSKEK